MVKDMVGDKFGIVMEMLRELVSGFQRGVLMSGTRVW